MIRLLLAFTFASLVTACLDRSTGITDADDYVSSPLIKAADPGLSNDLSDEVRVIPGDGWTVIQLSQGEVRLDIKPDGKEPVDLKGVSFVSLLKLEGGTHITGGTVSQGTYFQGMADLDGKGELLRPCTLAGTSYTLNMTKGWGGVLIKENRLEKVTFSVDAEVEVAVSTGSETPLAIKGDISNGTYLPNEGVTFTANLSLAAPFYYKTGELTLNLKSGTFGVEVKQSSFIKATLEVTADMDVTILDSEGLKLEGPLKGKYENNAFDLDGTLQLREPFTYKKGKLIVDMASGTFGVEVKQSSFIKATLEVTADMDVTISDSEGLKLGGSLKGKYENNTFDLGGTLQLRAPFTYKKSQVYVRLNSGEVSVDVKQSQFTSAEFTAEADVEVALPECPTLKLKGIIQGSIHESHTIDLLGSISIMEDFIYQHGAITATLEKGGSVGVKVTESEFQWADIESVNMQVSLSIADQELLLEGEINDGKYDNNGLIDVEGEIGLVAPVSLFQEDAFTVTLTSASVGVKVVQSEISDVSVNNGRTRADVIVCDKVLGLEGYTAGSIDDKGVDLSGTLTLPEDFHLKRDPVTLTLQAGGGIDINVQDSRLKSATFENLPFTVRKTDENGNEQSTEGSADRGAVKNGSIRLISKDLEAVELKRVLIIRDDDDEDDNDEDGRGKQ